MSGAGDPTTTRRFARGGVALAYRDAGAGVPFVFQHGLGGDAAQPASQAPGGCRVVTLECRGHGASALGPEAELGFATFAADLEALLDALGIERAVVGGISMGAGVALALAARAPERVAALALVRPAWADQAWPRNLDAFAEVARALRDDGPAGGRRFAASSRAYRQAAIASPSTAASLLGQFARAQARERVAVLERLPADRPLAPEAWPALAVPALVLATHGDPVHPLAIAERVAALLPEAELVEVPSKDAGETAHRAAVAAALTAFATRSHRSRTRVAAAPHRP
jgi:pimeloyl-ACP methyl ester carboxylesterase